MRQMGKVGLTAVLTAVLCFAITATTGAARREPRKTVALRVGDVAMFQGLDVICSYINFRGLRGVYCDRASTGGEPSVGTWTTRYKLEVHGNARGTPTVFATPRDP